MFNLITKFSGKAHSDLIRKYFYNVIGKVYILFQASNDEIQTQITPLREPNFLFASCFLEQLKVRDLTKRNTMAVLQLLKEAAGNVVGLLPILLKEETVQKAITIIELFQQESFVEFVLKDSSNEVERVLIIDALEKVLSGKEVSQTQSNAVKSRLQHRKQILTDLCAKPTLVAFLRSDEASVLIWDWAIGVGNKNVLHRLQFHTAVEEFKSLETKALMPSRAALIWERYLEAGSNCEVAISQSARDDVNDQIQNDKVTRFTFTVAQKEVVLSLNSEFETSFLPSNYYERLRSELESVKTKIDLLFRGTIGDDSSRGSFLGGTGTDVMIDTRSEEGDDIGAGAGADADAAGEGGERLSTLWK